LWRPRNCRALYVGGHLTIEKIDGLQIEGLAVVNQDVRINAAAANVVVLGALFVKGAFVETTADLSGNGHTGLIRGNPAWTGGRLGAALQLDGVDDYLDCGTNPAFDIAGAVTVAAWVNTRDAGDNQPHPYVTKGDHPMLSAPVHRRGPGSTIEFFIYDGSGSPRGSGPGRIQARGTISRERTMA
jgi:hypothetical protein